MKKIYNVLCGILLAVLLLIGAVSMFDKDPVYSTVEDRTLNSMPKVTFSGIFNGEFFHSLQEYYADTFPGREGMAGEKGFFDVFFGFTGVLEDQTAENP